MIGLITSTICLLCYLTWHNSYATKRILYLREFSTNQFSTSPAEKFVICYSYWEQQTNSVLNLWSFQKWANLSGNFSVVEPFASNSVLEFTYDLANQHHFDKALRFRDYFDIERWTKGTAKYGIPPLVSWKTFTQHTSKEVIVVLLAYDASPGGYYEGDKIKNNRRCKEESRKHMCSYHVGR